MAEKTVYIIDLDDKVTPKLKGVQNEAKKTDSTFGGLGKSLIGGLSIAGGVAAIGTLAKGIYDVTAAAEQSKIQFEVMLGSVSKADAMIGQIRQFAAATPFETKDLEDAATTMLGYGIAAEDIMPNIRMLGDVAGGNAEKLGRLTYAFSQISANSRLMGQDLMQLINSGFNPLQTISEKTGLSMSVLKQKMEDGAISADMVKNAFAAETSKGGRFFEMTARQAQTLSGRMGTLVDDIKNIGIELGGNASKGFGQLLDLGIKSVAMIKDTAWSDFFSSWGEMINPAKDAFIAVFQLFGMSSELGIGFQHVIDGITISMRLMVLPIKAIIDSLAILVEVMSGIGVAAAKMGAGDFEGAMDAFGGVRGKYDKLKKDFTSLFDFEGGRGFGEALEKKAPVEINTESKYNAKGFDNLYNESEKEKKSRKKSAGGLTLNESKNGSTNITFNIDTFQKNEFAKDGVGVNNSAIKGFLDQMALGLQTVLNDSQIVARQ